MLYALAEEVRCEDGCVTVSADRIEEAAERLDAQTVMIRGFELQRDALLEIMEELVECHGDCDYISEEEKESEHLIVKARAAIAVARGCAT